MTLNGEFYSTLNIYVSSGNSKTVEIRTNSDTDYGTYVINVPEGTVHTTAYNTSSAEANDR